MQSPFRADLHCHSTCSDGSFGPVELVQAAVAAGLQGLSITDHDTVDAYTSALDAAKQLKLSLVSGVEFSATLDGCSVHILGYAFALNDPAILQLCERHTIRREERNREILAHLAKLRMPLTYEEIAQEQGSSIGRPHIAQALLKKGYVSSIQDAFKRYIGEGRPAYAKGAAISAEETLATIQQAKGMAVIAHPHLIQNVPLLKKVLEMPFDGIECYYARFSAESNAPWLEVAQKRGWLMTGGSDFHGTVKPNIPLGASWVGDETFHVLQERHLRNNG